jgi:hypothetical protein
MSETHFQHGFGVFLQGRQSHGVEMGPVGIYDFEQTEVLKAFSKLYTPIRLGGLQY